MLWELGSKQENDFYSEQILVLDDRNFYSEFGAYRDLKPSKWSNTISARLKSDIADLKNVGGRAGGSITAAKFLQNFVSETPWAHIDIAGTGMIEKPQAYIPKGGTGYGVRLLTEFIRQF